MKYKLSQIFGVLFCGSAVVLGAFGAHLLSDMLSADALQSFEVGVRYQFFHGLALLLLSLSPGSKKVMSRTALLFVIGTLLFSSSIYLLSLSTMYGDTGQWSKNLQKNGKSITKTSFRFILDGKV